MFKKISKNLIIFSSLFLTFFCFQNVFAETGDKGIIIESFEYNQNGELTLSWSVDDGYEDIFYNYYNRDITKIYIMDDPYESIDISDTGYGWGWVGFYTSLLDCLEPYDESTNFQEISVSDFGVKTCSMKFYKIFREYGGELYPSVGNYITKTDIDNAFYTDFLESITISFRSGPWNFSDIYGGGTYSFESEDEPVMILTSSNTFPILSTPTAINGVCGDANGSTFDWADYNDQDFCSTGDFYLSGDNSERMIYACVGLNGGTTQYNCFADYYHDLDPTITDVIDFDFDNFTYDFDEGDVSKNWLIDVFKFLFLPREQTLQKFFTTFENFKQKIPFGYIYLIQDKFKQASLESTEEFALNLELLGEDYEVFSVTSLKQDIGENTFNVFYNTMKALIWFIFVLYLITKSQKLFNNND